MKTKLTLIVCMSLLNLVTFAQQPFISTWSPFFGNTSISFGTVTTGPVSYSWVSLPPATPASGSGTFQGPNVTISGLPADSRIRLTIQPQNFKRILGAGFSYSISEINQWGTVEWISMENAFTSINPFSNGIQLVDATDIPNLSNVTSMANMFSGSVALNSPFNINSWNISNVTNLSGMFKGCQSFNQALSLWNTSNVTDMSSMFEGAQNFNQNIGNWNTSNVTNMSKMFKDASAFNRNIGNWNTASVTDMSEMFFSTIFSGFPSAFNQNIGNWNTANVINMSGMFKGAISFNQNIGNWNTSNVTNMSDMFNQAFSFNQNIGNWNTSSVTNMSSMFRSDFVGFTAPFATISLFNNGGSTSIENWNTSNVTDMSKMFFKAENFNRNLGNWALNSNVNLVEMLDRSGLDCKNYSKTIIGWNNNPNTPNNKVLGATFMEYGPEAVAAINNLIFNKGWGFSGHDFFSVTPQFNLNNTYCEGASIPSLPTISEEGVIGVWSPQLNSSQTTTYTFVPTAGQCATTSALTININPFPIPTGNANQSFNANSTIADIVVGPATILWYASSQDAIADTNPLPLNTLLQNGFTYYAVNDNGQCRSQPFSVTVSLNLSVDNNDFLSFKYYPNPVSSILTISASNTIKNIEVYNLLGQLLINKRFNDTDISIDLNELPNSIYMIKVKSENLSREFKIMKQ
ncbi:BspA family leucine-rich repeat surface protein [Flavobacterium sp. RSB2_4_14]|uniref:BspA family leucine-rich repeat surface protein n=1 Tax=Flavobacterium sp. RSB2_4_14 TaxID=3447665 RepID=UPI003F2EE747